MAKTGRTEEAEKLFDRAHQVDPDNIVVLNAKGNLLARIGRFEEAEKLFHKHKIEKLLVVDNDYYLTGLIHFHLLLHC